jgi:flagellin-like protein
LIHKKSHRFSTKFSTKAKRSVRAISPVIATLLMIAIAVAASLVAYSWVMGYMGFTTSKVDKAIMIQSVTTGSVYVQNVGDSAVRVTGIYVNGVADSLELDYPIDSTKTQEIPFAKDYTGYTRMTVKVVCDDGTITEYVKTNPSPGGGGAATQYNIAVTMNPSGAGSIDYSPTGPYTTGTVVTLTPVANPGFTFQSWSGDGEDGTGITRIITVTANMAVTAEFTQDQYSIAVTMNPSPAAGTITYDPTGIYTYNQEVTLTPNVNTGYTFSSWSGAGTNGAGNTRIVTVIGNMDVTATFTQNQYTVTVTQNANGVIAPGTTSYVHGSTPSFTITPNSGYRIASITANGASVPVTNPNGQTYQFPALTGAGTLTANYIPITVTRISASTSGFSGIQAGDLLVVIANTRSSNSNGALPTYTASANQGFGNAKQVASFQNSNNDRRGVAIFTKTATGSETGTVAVTWSNGATTNAISYQIFRQTSGGTNNWQVIAQGANHGISGTSTTLNPLPSTALPSGTTPNVLTIGAIVGRDGPNTATFSALPTGLYNFNSGGAYSSTAYIYGLPITSTGVSWSGSYRVSGLLIQVRAT